MKRFIFMALSLLFTAGLVTEGKGQCLNLSAADVSTSSGLTQDACIQATIPHTDPYLQSGVTGTSNVEFRAHELGVIRLHPGFRAHGFSGSGQFRAHIESGALDIQVMAPEAYYGEVPQFEKFEVGIELPANVKSEIQSRLAGGNGLNPYDPADINVYLVLTRPDGTTKNHFGFYYEEVERDCTIEDWIINSNTPYPFRIRVAPEQLGTYTGQITLAYNNNGSTVTLHSGTIGFVSVASNNPGFLEEGSNGQMRFSGTQATFFPLGLNVLGANTTDCDQCSDYTNCINCSGCNEVKWENVLAAEDRWDNYLQTDANFDRLWMGFGHFDLTHHDAEIYDQAAAYQFEWYLQRSKEEDMYLRLTIDHAGEWGEAVSCAHAWLLNPYRPYCANGALDDFFKLSNTTVTQLYKNKLRYLVSRWGYSTNIAAWELFNEPDFMGKEIVDSTHQFFYDATFRNDVVAWHQHMHQYLSQSLKAPQLLAVSPGLYIYANLFGNDPYVDMLGFHDYGLGLGNDRVMRTKIIDLANTTSKLIQVDEFGHASHEVGSVTPVHMHTAVWSTAMTGHMGASLNYWNGSNYYGSDHTDIFSSVSDFMADVDFETGVFTPRLFPATTVNWDDVATYPVEVFYQTIQTNSVPAERAIGWINNRYNNWYNTRSTYIDQTGCAERLRSSISAVNCFYNRSQITQDIGCFSSNADAWENGTNSDVYSLEANFTALSAYSSCPTLTTPQVTLEGFILSFPYRIEFFDAADNQFVSSIVVSGGVGGQLTFQVPVDLTANRPALTFKVFPNGGSFRMAAEEGAKAEGTPTGLVKFFPNPATTELTLRSSVEQPLDVRISDLSGRMVQTFQLPSGSQQRVSIEALPQGTYVIEFLGEGYHQSERLVKLD